MSNYRKLLSGKEFEKLIPEPKNVKVELGDGNTFLSLELMAKMVADTLYETKELAQVLKQPTLKSTVEKIKWFDYNHFQYLRDGADQLLRTPAYAWKNRHTGFDCKTYSLIASSILSNLGIKHSFRQIKQGTALFTHVYVVVPIDQVNGNLHQGIYVIDGTIPDNTEPNYSEKYDYKMENMKHYGLMANDEAFSCNQPDNICINSGVQQVIRPQKIDATDAEIVQHVKVPVVTGARKDRTGNSLFIVENFSVRELPVTAENVEWLKKTGAIVTQNGLNGLSGLGDVWDAGADLLGSGITSYFGNETANTQAALEEKKINANAATEALKVDLAAQQLALQKEQAAADATYKQQMLELQQKQNNASSEAEARQAQIDMAKVQADAKAAENNIQLQLAALSKQNPEKDNTMMYVGIGAGVVAIGAIATILLKSKKAA